MMNVFPETVKVSGGNDLNLLNRTLRAICNCNHAMMHAGTEDELLNEICRIIVEDCGHAMVWIGFARDDDQKTVLPVAYSGFEEGYLQALDISWSDDSIKGHGPTGTAIRTGQICYCRDMLTDPNFLPWRENALKLGYASSASIPIIDDGKSIGAITVYSQSSGSISESEAAFLAELANDIAFGVKSIRTRLAREKAEKELIESQSKIKRKLEAIISPDGDINDLELGDIIDSIALQSLMNNFYELAHVPMSIIDLKGNMLVGVGWQEICMNFHRVHPVACQNCLESDLLLTKGIPEGEFRLYNCKNNMWDIATPLIIGGRHMGNLFMGQFFIDDEPIDYGLFNSQAEKYGFDKTEYIKALDKVPRISTEFLENAKAFFINFANMISKLSYSNIKLARSIEERDSLMDSLRKSEERFFTTLSSVGDAVMATDTAGRITFMNNVAESLTGWTQAEALGRHEQDIFKIVNEDSRLEVESPIQNVLKKGAIVGLANHTVLIRKDGSEVPIDDSGAPIKGKDGSIVGVVLVFRDITDRKKAEREISASKARLERSQEMAHLGSWELDLISNTLTWSDEVYRIFGLKPQEFGATYEAFLDAIHPDDRGLVDNAYSGSIKQGKDSYEVEHRVIRRNTGEIRYVHEKCFHKRDKSGSIIKSIGMVHDITDQYITQLELKESSQRLKQSEQRFRLALNYSPVAVFTQDWDLKYTWMYQSIFNIPNESFIGRSDEQIFSIKDSSRINQVKRKVMETGQPRNERLTLSLNEKEYHLDLTIEPLYDEMGSINGIACAAVNITELVRLESEKTKQEIARLIERSSRLASVGVIAGGITHEINQPLNAIRVGAEGILFWNKRNNRVLPEIIVEMIDGISAGVKRIDEIIKSIRSFWISTENETLEEVDTSPLINKVLAFNSQKLKNHGIIVKTDFTAGDLLIMANGLRMELVLNNLITNAIYSIDKAGKKQRLIKVSSYISNSTVFIDIEDSGTGLPDVSLDKLFDPFFTTRAAEDGSGLGLAIVKMFLDKFNASIDAFNNDMGGATFRIGFDLTRQKGYHI